MVPERITTKGCRECKLLVKYDAKLEAAQERGQERAAKKYAKKVDRLEEHSSCKDRRKLFDTSKFKCHQWLETETAEGQKRLWCTVCKKFGQQQTTPAIIQKAVQKKEEAPKPKAPVLVASTVEEFLSLLKRETDPRTKSRIRAALRKLGHRGGAAGRK